MQNSVDASHRYEWLLYLHMPDEASSFGVDGTIEEKKLLALPKNYRHMKLIFFPPKVGQ